MPQWIWFAFVFAFGCCIGSFLNVVIYRLPRDKSLVTPPSACPSCGKHIRFYDNIPLLSWLMLRGRCRNCRASISPRYFAVELLTGSVFLGLFVLYFQAGVREGLVLRNGGWLVYLLHIAMLAAFIAASAIDLELWIIPLSVCWFATAAGLVVSAVGPLVIPAGAIRGFDLLPVASAETGAMAVGAAAGLGVSWLLVTTGLLQRSYESEHEEKVFAQVHEADTAPDTGTSPADEVEEEFNHRLESFREILFLLPVVIGALIAYQIVVKAVGAEVRMSFAAQHPVPAGLLGSLWGYFVGCGIVWAIRIFGTLAFAKEAMGLGDVHLMGAAGAVVGPVPVAIAFFIAPFFGLAWAGVQMVSKKIHQIPYGPFLSIGVLVVMILHDWFMGRIGLMFGR